MNIHQRLREVRVTPLMAACFLPLVFVVPFGVAWAMDDGSWNQPFPRGLRRLVVAAAAGGLWSCLAFPRLLVDP